MTEPTTASKTYFDTVRPTYLENWPVDLHELSFPSERVPLSLDDARRLGANIAEQYAQFDDGSYTDYPPSIANIRERVAAAVAKFPAGAFIRLGSRSPKDSWSLVRNGAKILPGDGDPLRFLLDASERIADDLHLALMHGHEPSIWVRQWQDIPPWQEWRCFRSRGRIVGISQYHYKRHYPEITFDYRLGTRDRIHYWHAHSFMWRVPPHQLADCVIDVAVNPDVIDPRQGIRLIEVNPWIEYTDPCLFKWDKDAYHGGDFGGFMDLRYKPDPAEEAKAQRSILEALANYRPPAEPRDAVRRRLAGEDLCPTN